MTDTNASRTLASRSTVFRLVRGSNWWSSKIPPLLSAAYAMLLFDCRSPASGMLVILALLFSICSLAAFGHIINDTFDIEEDRRAGKANTMAKKTPRHRLFLCLLFFGLGFLPFIIVDLGPLAMLALAVNYVLPMVYSIPPMRLKERGICGAVADAAGVHAFPTLFVVTALSHWVRTGTGGAAQLIIAVTTWALLYGLRGILLHQLWDRDNDIRAEATTLVAGAQPSRIRTFVRWVLFPLETVALGGVLWALFPVLPEAVLVVIIYAVFDTIRLKTWHIAIDPAPSVRGNYVLPSDLYEVWLPLGLAVALSTRHPAFLGLAASHVILFYSSVRMRVREVVLVSVELLRRYRERPTSAKDGE